MTDTRFCELKNWMCSVGHTQTQIEALAGDASSSRFFRVHLPEGTSLIALDAPPGTYGKEDIRPFVAIGNSFLKHNIHVPIIYHHDAARGFMLLEDFGDQLYFHLLTSENADTLYKNAIDELIKIQQCQSIEHHVLPHFDASFMKRELSLFQEWFIEKHLKVSLSPADQKLLSSFFTELIHLIEMQPIVCVHRDYHSRNLIWRPNQTVGVIDFQDAVQGPVTYDLVSLLKDCYVDWPLDQVRTWVAYYFDAALEQKILTNVSFDTFYQWFTCMGIQRHLKAAFIFARMNLLYNKPGFLKDIPRTMNYVTAALSTFPSMQAFEAFLQELPSWT